MTTVQTNWVALFGSFLLLCTLILTTYAGGATVAGARRQSRPLIRSSIYRRLRVYGAAEPGVGADLLFGAVERLFFAQVCAAKLRRGDAVV